MLTVSASWQQTNKNKHWKGSMNKHIAKLLLGAALVGFTAAAQADTLLNWDLTGKSSAADATTVNATTVTTGLLTSTLTRGAGAAWSTASDSFRTTGFGNNGLALTNTDYFQWTVTADSGYKFSISSLDATFRGTATYNAGGVSMNFAYSLDGNNWSWVGSPFGTSATGSNGVGIAGGALDLSGIGALQDITSSVTFRFFATGDTNTGGWGFYGSNGLTMFGEINPLSVPEPSTWALIGVGMGVLFVTRLSKKEKTNS